MYLVNKKHITRLERRQDRGDITFALQRRARDRMDTALHLGRHDKREARLTKTGWARQQHVIAGLIAAARGSNERL